MVASIILSLVKHLGNDYDISDIYFKRKFKFEIVHNDDNHYYDGYHNHVWIGWHVFFGT